MLPAGAHLKLIGYCFYLTAVEIPGTLGEEIAAAPCGVTASTVAWAGEADGVAGFQGVG